MSSLAMLFLNVLPLLSLGALALAWKQKNHASLMGAAAVLSVSTLTAVMTDFSLPPLSDMFIEGGWTAVPPYLMALYGIGAAAAWRVARSPGSLRAAIASMIAAGMGSYLCFQSAMRDVNAAVLHADPADQFAILNGSLGEANRIFQVAGIYIGTAAVIMLTASRNKPTSAIPQTFEVNSRVS